MSWDTMTESDRKTFSPYMINRFLSMNSEWLPYINQLQRLTIGLLSPRDVFRVYYEFLPKGKVFLKYVKTKSPINVPDSVADVIMTAYECSEREMVDYYRLLIGSEEGRSELKTIMENYGMQKTEIDKLRKEIKTWKG